MNAESNIEIEVARMDTKVCASRPPRQVVLCNLHTLSKVQISGKDVNSARSKCLSIPKNHSCKVSKSYLNILFEPSNIYSLVLNESNAHNHSHQINNQTRQSSYSSKFNALNNEFVNQSRLLMLDSEVKKSLKSNNDEEYPCSLNSIMNNYTSRKHESVEQVFALKQSSIKRSLLFILVLAALLCLKNASPCSSFSDFEPDHNFGLTQFDYQSVPFTQRTYLTPHNVGFNWNRRPRSFPDIESFGMSPTTSSFTQDDQSSSVAPQANSWTSIFTNPFGTGTTTNNANGDSLDRHIKSILVPRVSGTPGNLQVRQYIVDNLKRNDYHVELDEFTANTPVGSVNFANIIASSNPDACRQLVLACHYDSKMMDGFLGATDSAVPCAMLLKMSETFNKSFKPVGEMQSDQDLGLKFIFFDGEEAFVQWTSTDSLYGSRHLAAKWDKMPLPEQCKSRSGKNELSRIELFVLLDLIGTSDTSFVIYNTRLRHHYDALQSFEKAHMAKNGFHQLQIRREMAFRNKVMSMDFVEDDHVPFKRRGVPILLLLAHPFPTVWHRNEDNYNAIDFQKTRRILHALEEFVANYSKKKD